MVRGGGSPTSKMSPKEHLLRAAELAAACDDTQKHIGDIEVEEAQALEEEEKLDVKADEVAAKYAAAPVSPLHTVRCVWALPILDAWLGGLSVHCMQVDFDDSTEFWHKARKAARHIKVFIRPVPAHRGVSSQPLAALPRITSTRPKARLGRHYSSPKPARSSLCPMVATRTS